MIDTTRFGALEFAEDRVISFPQGLVAFADFKRFVLLDHAPGSPFHWLQSIERGDLAFPLVDPDHFVSGYLVAPPAGLAGVIGSFEPADLWLGVLVTFRSGDGPSLNLKAPIILNTRTRCGVQAVLEDPAAPIRYPIGSER